VTGVQTCALPICTLVYANRYPASQQHALAAQMCIEPMTLVGYLDRLEARGFIRRERDPSDGRAKIVRVTPEAKPLLDRATAVARAAREAAMQEFQSEEVENMRSYLLRMRLNLTRDQHRTAAE
jgi:MarR family transcriptional regulator for hemolysin